MSDIKTATPTAGERIAADFDMPECQALIHDIDAAIRDSRKELLEALELAWELIKQSGISVGDLPGNSFEVVQSALANAHSGQEEV